MFQGFQVVIRRYYEHRRHKNRIACSPRLVVQVSTCTCHVHCLEKLCAKVRDVAILQGCSLASVCVRVELLTGNGADFGYDESIRNLLHERYLLLFSGQHCNQWKTWKFAEKNAIFQ